MRRKSIRKRLIRGGLLTANIAILVAMAIFITQNPHQNTAVRASALASAETTSSTTNPLDQVSSANIALTVAQMSRLPEATAVSNQAQTQAADLAAAPATDNVLAKPQVVQTALKSRANIQTYSVQSGDTVSNIATKFGITSDSIRWSNKITGDAVSVGTKLTIPPVTGIVYTVVAGDTADSLATKFKANKDQIIAYNDAEINGLQAGEQVIIPNGTIASASSVTGGGTVLGGTRIAFSATYGGNGYDFGYCTWYVATQIAVPTNWGNASSWAYYARLSGWTVSSTPTVGAIAQTAYAAGGEGHVAVVDAVSADGTQIQYRDMNGIAGFDHVGQSGWVPATRYQNYITH